MRAPGCYGGPCIKYPAGGCNGPTGTATCGLCKAEGWTLQAATIVRVDPLGVGYVECGGHQFGFTFDKIAGYRGEPAKELGIVRGATVQIETNGEVVIRVVPPEGDKQ